VSAPPAAVAVAPPRSRTGAVALGAPVLGGVLYFLGYVGYGVWPCLLVFLIPLWTALERADGWRPAAAAGLAFGATAYIGGFLWLWRLVAVFLDGNRILGGILWAAYGAWFALGFAVYGALFHGVRRRGWPIAVAGVAPLVAVEWLQPQLFPLYAGNGLVAAPTWTQLADLGGPLLLTALLGVANVGVLATWDWWHGRGRPVSALAAIAVVGAALAYGRVRMARVDAAVSAAPALRVGVVQANLGVLEKTALALVTHQRHLDQTRELLAAGPVDLVVWPETAYVRGLRRPLPLSGRPILEELSVPLLFGGSSVEERDGRRWKANSAFLIGADGVIRDAYDKNLLIPLAEYVPFASLVPALGRWFPHVDDFAASTDVPALHLGPWRIATPICYEAIRPEFVRRMMRRSRPHLLVTLANDAWFGDSQEPWLHLALARLRAVEHRRFLVRATNSGVSAVVDPAGRVVAMTGVLTRETLRATVHPLEGETVYTRLGDWPGWLAAAIVVVGVALSAPGRSGSSRRPASRTAARARDGC
jgi:apolipoprotein N-acyltransferase